MAKQDDYIRYTIRVPASLYAKIQEAAGAKSVNAEIVSRLEASFSNDLSEAAYQIGESAARMMDAVKIVTDFTLAVPEIGRLLREDPEKLKKLSKTSRKLADLAKANAAKIEKEPRNKPEPSDTEG